MTADPMSAQSVTGYLQHAWLRRGEQGAVSCITWPRDTEPLRGSVGFPAASTEQLSNCVTGRVGGHGSTLISPSLSTLPSTSLKRLIAAAYTSSTEMPAMQLWCP